jgi:predicted ATPase
LLVRRIEEVPLETRQVLEAASVVGEEFAVAAVAAGVQRPVEDVEAACEGLAVRHRFLEDTGVESWPDGSSAGRYRFQHALYAQVLYEHLGRVRRRQLHRHIGTRLEAGYGARAGEVAVQLAMHFERGGETSRAVHYWQQVGQNAARRHAHQEAITALTTGLALLATLPEGSERIQRELTFQLLLGELWMAAKGMGAPEAGEAFTRAHRLCHQLGETPQRFRVLQGLYRFHEGQAALHAAGELSQQLFHLAHQQSDAGLVLEAQSAMASVALFGGDLAAARAYLEPCLPRGDAPSPPALTVRGGHHLASTHLAWMAHVLWGLGYADQAQQRSEEALALAQHLGHPPSLGHAYLFAAIISQRRQDIAATHARADVLMAFATAQGLVHRVEQGRMLRGWALAMQGDAATGVVQIRQGLAVHHDLGIKLGQPYSLALLAEAYGQTGQPEAGLQVLAEALTLVAAREERGWEAELYRLQGTLRLQLPHPDAREVEACFQQALAVARRQQARSLELRAAMSLAQLWRRQGQRDDARQLLAPIYGWFTEGFDTPDLQEAKALLEELA